MNKNEFELNAIEEKIKKLLETKQLDPNNAEEYINSILAFVNNNIPKEKLTSVYNLIVELARKMSSGRKKWAIQSDYLEKILELNPERKELHYWIAEANEFWNFEKAIKHFELAYSLKQDSQLLFRIGNIYGRMENHKSAIKYFKECIEKGYENSAVLSNLGEAYLYINDFLNARFWLYEALEIEKDEESVERINKILFIAHTGSITFLLNKLIRDKNLVSIKPGYHSFDEGNFKTSIGEDFSIWRFDADEANTEVIRIYDEKSNAIGLWLDSSSGIVLRGFVFRHQLVPDNIQYLINIQPRWAEEINVNSDSNESNSEQRNVQKRNIDLKFAMKEYGKLESSLSKSGLEIIPDLENILS